MRVQLNGENTKCLERIFLKDGDKVVSNGEITLSDVYVPGEINGTCHFPEVFIEGMGLTPEKRRIDFTASKWFDSEWRPQTLIGIPAHGMMNGNLGADVVTAFGLKPLSVSPLSELFDLEPLKKSLLEMSYQGFVTFSLSLCLGGDNPYSIVSLQTGLPYFGLFNVVESIPGRMVDFVLGKVPDLLESWTINIVLSRPPWPESVPPVERIFFSPTIEELKHLWFPGALFRKRNFSSSETLVGIATSWAVSISEANRRTLRTLRNLAICEKQYRTDVASVVAQMAHRLRGRGLLGSYT